MLYKYPYTDLYNLNLDWMIKAIKEMQAIVEPLSIIVNTFNGRHGDVELTLDDVNAVMVDVLWISSPGDTIDDLPQASLDSLYRIGRRIMIFINNANVPDTIYFLKWSSGHARPQLYSPTAALAGVASFNGRTGNVTATGTDLATSDSDSTSIADTLEAQSQQIVNLGNAIAYVENGDNATRTYTAGQFVLWKGTLYTVNSEGIPSSTAIAGHVTAATNGGLNALKTNIDTLNSVVTRKISYETAYDITVGTGTNVFYADQVNRTLFTEMVFLSTEDIPANSLIGHVVNNPSINRTHWTAVTSTGVFIRLVIDPQCRVLTESPIPANVWVSTSVVCLINV